jgi:hypothetical protein
VHRGSSFPAQGRTLGHVWIVLVLFVLALAVGLYWFATVADRIEDDSRGMVDERTRAPYGSKWLSILSGSDRRR